MILRSDYNINTFGIKTLFLHRYKFVNQTRHKFMYEKILSGLKTKFAGVDPKILERIAKKKAETTTTEEEAKTVVDGVTFQSIIESEGDRRANEAQNTAITNMEQENLQLPYLVRLVR